MSDRLISADKAKAVLKHLLYETAMDNDLDIADIYEDIAEKRINTWIELIPTVDADEVVRCKDCKWWNTDKIHKCVAYDAFWITDADDYCAWGERKNGQ